MKKVVLDDKENARVRRFAEIFSQLPPEAQEKVTMYALAADAVSKAYELREQKGA